MLSCVSFCRQRIDDNDSNCALLTKYAAPSLTMVQARGHNSNYRSEAKDKGRSLRSVGIGPVRGEVREMPIYASWNSVLGNFILYY